MESDKSQRIATIVQCAISVTDLNRQLNLLELTGNVISVSVTKMWDGWQGKHEAKRMDVVIIHRRDG